MVNIMHPALAYLIYIVTSFAMLGLFMLVYTQVTPHREFQLIREGNVAAALSLGGAVLGFSLTLSSSIQHSTSVSTNEPRADERRSTSRPPVLS
ncbi:DUF350 domain-containing protein [Cupriavidus necator]|uniref:DUF350 domain-containing protein n=1 Tax=Cupriavidus necator TaxID=106590 RepID=A0A2P1DUV4_CUPNE|nr:DUF350 domain-containing protein [Cupriavidus necator]AVK72173.1 DUF350 domain-containing protein [Cupriavidus necator]